MAKLCLKNEEEITPAIEEGYLATEDNADENGAPIEDNINDEAGDREDKADAKAVAPEDSADNEDAFVLLQKLEADETRLSEQKEHLSLLLEQLQAKVREEIEKKRRRVQKLNSEVKHLKIKCEKFARLVNTSVLPK
jgi:predicted RNase H-like nuclease (RuvC/YqgF family)